MPPSPPTSSGIALDGVHFAYGRQPVVVGVRWEVPAGAVAALFGGTASGKSTLLALLAGALAPKSGTVRVAGADPATAAGKRLLGFMPQLDGLYGDLTVEDNMAVFAAAAGSRVAASELIEKTLELVELRSRRHEAVRTLSAGQQARVSLAAALVGQPSVLLLDEPFAHADPAFAERLWGHLHELTSKGRTVVVATQHPHVAARAQHVAVLRGGRLVASGETASLAPAGKAAVRLSYREKTGPLVKEVAMEDYRQELPNYVHGAVAKPYAIEIQPETVESQLTKLLTQESGHALARGE